MCLCVLFFRDDVLLRQCLHQAVLSYLLLTDSSPSLADRLHPYVSDAILVIGSHPVIGPFSGVCGFTSTPSHCIWPIALILLWGTVGERNEHLFCSTADAASTLGVPSLPRSGEHFAHTEDFADLKEGKWGHRAYMHDALCFVLQSSLRLSRRLRRFLLDGSFRNFFV